MESALYLRIFSSWEVVAACLFLMLLLPVVFFIASASGRRRGASRKGTTARRPAATPRAEGEDARPPSAGAERREAVDGPEDQAE